MKQRTAIRLALICGFGLLCFAVGADAALEPSTGNVGILDQVLNTYIEAATHWEARIRPTAEWLFWILVLIGMIWKFSPLVSQQADIGAFFSLFARFTIVTGFNWWLLQNGPAIAGDIISSLMTLGGRVIDAQPTTPSGVLNVGFLIFRKAGAFFVQHPIDGLAGIAFATAILMIIAAIAMNVLITLILASVTTYGGFLLLGFGGAEWTSDITIRYFKRAINIGVKIFIMTLLVGAGNRLITDFYSRLSEGMKLEEMAVMLVGVFCLWMLIKTLPAEIASMVGDHSGGAGIGAGDVAKAAAGAVGAAAGAAAGVAGGASAIIAAVQQGQANTAAGTDVVGKLGNAIGGAAAPGGSMADNFGGGSGSSSAGGRSLAEQMGMQGATAASAASSAGAGGQSRQGAGLGSGGVSGSAGANQGQGKDAKGSGGSSTSTPAGGGGGGGDGNGQSPGMAGLVRNAAGAVLGSTGGGSGPGRSLAAQMADGQQGAGETAGGSGTAPARGGSLGDAAARMTGELLEAAATMGRIGVDAGANLAAGMWDSTVAGTAGGRVAAAIRARGAETRAAQARGNDEGPAFEGDSLSAAGFVPAVPAESRSAPDAAEIAAFANRS